MQTCIAILSFQTVPSPQKSWRHAPKQMAWNSGHSLTMMKSVGRTVLWLQQER